MALELVYRPTAQGDLDAIYDWIADHAGPNIAFLYVGRIEAACRALLDFPGRGTPHDELAPGLRSIVFERRATIYYRLTARSSRLCTSSMRGAIRSARSRRTDCRPRLASPAAPARAPPT